MVHRIENGVLEDARSLTVGQEDRKFSNSMKLRRAHRRQILSSDRENIGSRIYLPLFIFASQKSPKTYESSRSSLGGLATGGTEGAEWSTFISGGYDFHLGHLSVGPIDALQYTYVNINGFSEESSLAPLAVHSGSAESLRSDFGFRAFYQWQIGKIVVEPWLKAAWEHEYKYSALPITAGFAGIPGPSATFSGPNKGAESRRGHTVRFQQADRGRSSGRE
jgi:Autotransporter beta-domain